MKLFNLSKFVDKIFGTRAAGFYILTFAIAIGVATFIENDFGTSAAQKVVFKTKWFELLLILFCGALLYNIYRYRMIPLKKWALLTFHLSMVIIVLGAGITRYFGYEGMMHIREGEQSSTFRSADTYLTFEAQQGGGVYSWEEPILLSSLGSNKFNSSYKIGNHIIEVGLKNVIPNPKRELVTTEGGIPIMKVVLSGKAGREEYFIRSGEKQLLGGILFNWDMPYDSTAVNIRSEGEKLHIATSYDMTRMVMATQERIAVPAGQEDELYFRSLYSSTVGNFVIADYNPTAKLELVSESKKVKNESTLGLELDITVDGIPYNRFIFGQKGVVGNPTKIGTEDMLLSIAYGSKIYNLPFALHLYDFEMERYPGTNSPASYASDVQLIDPQQNIKMDYKIFMNNILDHRGFRFFQSSYDTDELGTYLSVNYDFWGTMVSYIGYGLLTLGLIGIFFSRRSRFYELSQKVEGKRILMLLFYICGGIQLVGQESIMPNETISQAHAALFSEVIVQDLKGRMKPMHTMSRELLRKMSGKESVGNMNADQVILGMYANKALWLSQPLIKVGSHPEMESLIGSTAKVVSYKQFFNKDGSYKLRDMVRVGFAKQPADRSTFDKELLKIDERVNIANMIFSGRILTVIPVPGDVNNKWVSDSRDHNDNLGEVPVADKFFPAYRAALNEGNMGGADQIVRDLIAYQRQKGGSIMPSETKVSAEIALNKSKVFNRLSGFYALLGLCYLGMLFISVFKPDLDFKKWGKALLFLLMLGFAMHTLGLALRWYVSGRAPWSNGYESMIYIAWTSTLAGIIFTRKSYGGLAATMILAGTVLLVAMLSYLDPEITPLVPVLRSYWLTIHVSLIAGSYGFLMLGAIIGVINLLLMALSSIQSKDRVVRVVREMTYISEMTLIGGLVMISIGTYLGGVWANESWGRYWGWDAKETWALVTILVYAFILHMRIMPKFYSLYSYNLATLFGFASVVMTYFGVNYYLSGLHSYAAGDPIPIPNWVYISVVCLTILSIYAYWRKRVVGWTI